MVNLNNERSSKKRSLDKAEVEVSYNISGKRRRFQVANSNSDENKPGLGKKRVETNENMEACCWHCHSFGNVEWSCASCSRMYHSDCRKKLIKDYKVMNINDDICPECQPKLTLDGSGLLRRSIDLRELKEILKFIIHKIKINLKKEKLNNCDIFENFPEEYQSRFTQCMDFNILEDRVDDDMYDSTATFYADVKYISYNCAILAKEHKVYTSLVKVAEKKQREFLEELLFLEACDACFYVQNQEDMKKFGTRALIQNLLALQTEAVEENSNLHLCKPPHDLLWVYYRKSGTFWPAKCLKSYGDKVNVLYFGGLSRKTVKVSDCYHLSNHYPVAVKRVFLNETASWKKLKPHQSLIKAIEQSYEFIKFHGKKFNICDKITLYDPKQHVESGSKSRSSGMQDSREINNDDASSSDRSPFANLEERVVNIISSVRETTTPEAHKTTNKEDDEIVIVAESSPEDVRQRFLRNFDPPTLLKLVFSRDPKMRNSYEDMLNVINVNFLRTWGFANGNNEAINVIDTLVGDKKALLDKVDSSTKTIATLEVEKQVLQESIDEKNNTMKLWDIAVEDALKEKQKFCIELKKTENELTKLRTEKESLYKKHQELIQVIENYAINQNKDDPIEIQLKKEMEKRMKTDYCHLCLKPAVVRCCLDHNYCSIRCLDEDSVNHQSVCKKENELLNVSTRNNTRKTNRDASSRIRQDTQVHLSQKGPDM